MENYTTSEEIDNMVEDDKTIEIIGYVDGIEGTKMVGNPPNKPKRLYKIIVNNGDGRKVRVLFWEALATTWAPQITDGRMITIKRARSSRVNTNWLRANENICSIELSIMPYSEVILGDQVDNVDGSLPEQYVFTKISDIIQNNNDNIDVRGYVKVLFTLTNAGSGSLGSGAIIDGELKLRVDIGSFTPIENLQTGSRIRLRGQRRFDRHGNVYMYVLTSNDVTIVDDALLDTTELKKGYKISKRLGSDGDNNPNKRAKTN